MARTGGGRKSAETELGLIDRILTGESGRPINVAVEVVDRRSNTFITHNIEYVDDFNLLDFFLPLSLLILIFALQMFGAGFMLILFLQGVLLRDLYARIKRRPSGRRVTGLAPPFKGSDWGWAVLIYLAVLPLALGAGWVNRKIYIWLFPDSMEAFMENLSESLSMAGLAAVGITILLMMFFTTVVLAPVTEELWFRGIGQTAFVKKYGRFQAVLWTSLIFGILHGPTRFLFSAVMGVAFSWIRFRTGSLYCSMALHAVHNFAVLVIGLASVFW